ncbi:LysR family transcriptional regulator [Pseudoroseomonas wenyumeiae]|uniref:LysR family transcriptional regulator n=1 Tax=Teichococcus wenyumeiae TaxID=2478470 RepID=A0A3A9JD81_9PROT|nr:LysR substrate-binding domain-containing protein [Pseudoroseomonas wenyumeiae]RKK04472.1 LysR family transcriptional regulator [Pseudoroseomonas wenyumeiae]RMI25706.1 LysR family transcriptional regulator [Pseudoroseomonas wenyumeiae]
MTLDQLRIFVAVAEREHVTRAAEALNLTQSAVSAAIRALENRHGISLFHRVGRRIELTEAGRIFRTEAERVLARAQAAELVLSELGGARRGTLAVQASQTVASYWLPPLLVRFRASHPGVQVRVTAGNTTSVVQALMDGSTELGFVEGEVEEPALIQIPLAADQLIVVVGLNHSWGSGEPVPHARLTETAWIMREPGSGTRAAFEVLLPRLGLSLDDVEVALELPSNEAVLAAVEGGGGAAVVSERAAAPHLAAGLLARAGVSLPPRSFKALRHRERYASSAARALLELAG